MGARHGRDEQRRRGVAARLHRERERSARSIKKETPEGHHLLDEQHGGGRDSKGGGLEFVLPPKKRGGDIKYNKSLLQQESLYRLPHGKYYTQESSSSLKLGIMLYQKERLLHKMEAQHVGPVRRGEEVRFIVTYTVGLTWDCLS